MASIDIRIKCFRKIIKITLCISLHLGWFSSIDTEGRKMFTIFYHYQYVPKQLKIPKESIEYSRLQLMDGCWCRRLYVSVCVYRDTEHRFPICMKMK